MGAPKGGKGGFKGYTPKGKGKGGAKGQRGQWQEKGNGKGDVQKWVAVKPTVLVTSAAGFIASSVIRRLVDRRYKVRATVRSLEDSSKVAFLRKLFPKVELFEADLCGGSEAFEKAMEGCKYVIHCASPFKTKVDDPQKELVDPAVNGTEAVMNAAVKVGVSRVVLTSSVAAVGPPQEWLDDPSKADKDKVFTEEDWNSTSSLASGPYRYSKYLAEKKAWEIADATPGLSLAVICPSFVIGPPMLNREGESVTFIKTMLDGTMKENGCSGFPFGVVDVRAVSLAHVNAMESEEAGGKRFIVSSETGYPRIELAKMLQTRFKAYAIPTEGPTPDYTPKYSHARAKELLKFTPYAVERSLSDMARAAISLGVVERKVLLKPVVFGDVSAIDPESRGLNLIVKVVSLKDEETRGAKTFRDIVVGDATGIVTLSLQGNEIAEAEVGRILEVRNAVVRMLSGHIRIQVGKWGKVSPHAGDTEVTPKMDKDMSSTEYELVEA